MARICIVTPAAANARNGNRHTAARWAAMLRSAGHRVSIARRWGEEGRQGERCDLLIALHALYSHDSIRRYREARPRAPLVVALTGTDLYRDLPHSREARRSLYPYLRSTRFGFYVSLGIAKVLSAAGGGGRF